MRSNLIAVAEARPSRRSRHLTPEELAVVRYRLSSSQGPRPRLYGRLLPHGRTDEIAARPAVAAAIQRGIRHLLGTRALPAAVEALETILETSPHEANRIAAARALGDVAHRCGASDPGEPDDVPVLDMSEAQLGAVVDAARAQLGAIDLDDDIFA